MKKPKALIAVSHPNLVEHLRVLVALEKFDVTTIEHANDVSKAFDAKHYDLLLVEMNPSLDAQLGLLALPLEANCIFLSEGTPLQNLDDMMKEIAGYHFRSPYGFSDIDTAIEEFYVTMQADANLPAEDMTSSVDQFGLLVGSADCMRELYRTIHRVAPSLASVFIVGESGAGKELVARTIHLMSERLGFPFVAINCGAITTELADSDLFGHLKGAYTGAVSDRTGMFQRAEEGTLFLDEITEMPMDLQVKLLRVLETGEYTPVGGEKTKLADVRIVAASNRDPLEAIENGLLREDLYYRIAQFPIKVPTLRDRGDDVKDLAEHFLAYLNEQEKSQAKFSQAAINKLTRHAWPGNVRELKHTVHRAFLLGNEVITDDDIVFDAILGDSPSRETNNIPVGVPLNELEKHAITKTLEKNDGNKTETAEQLGISVKTLYNKLEKYQD